MSPDQFDLDAYCVRIGYDGSRAPNLATVQALHRLHPAMIPFEGLDPLLGRAVAIELPAVQAKLVRGRRGGYCFEQNTLFAAVLEALGVRVTALGARVRWMAPPDRPEGPRTHMVLLLDLPEGPHLADVGFGGFLLGEPVRLQPETAQKGWAGTVRLIQDGQVWTMQAHLRDAWHDLYCFTLEPSLPSDRVMGNWYTATHPASLFTTNLLAQRLDRGGRVSLFNATLTCRGHDGAAEERTLSGAADLQRVLELEFGIRLPAPAEAIWARLPGH